MNIEREVLLKTLGRVKPAVRSGGVVPALAHVWFDGKTVTAYDGGFGVKLAFNSDLQCGVPCTPLIGLLNTSALKDAVLEEKGAALQVKLGKSTSKLASLSMDGRVWPFPQKLPKGAKETDLGEDFIEALRKALVVKAPQPTRVEHYGVLAKRDGEDLTLYSTDSATMVAVTVEGAGAGVSFDAALLPRSFAEQIVSQSPEGVGFYVLSDCLVALGEDVSFYSSLMDISTADDMKAIVERKSALHKKRSPLPAGLEGALARAEVLAGAQESVIEVASTGKVLKITGSYSLGELSESLDLDEELPKASVRVLARHLRRAIPHSDEISVANDSLMMWGEPGYVYLVAQSKE